MKKTEWLGEALFSNLVGIPPSPFSSAGELFEAVASGSLGLYLNPNSVATDARKVFAGTDILREPLELAIRMAIGRSYSSQVSESRFLNVQVVTRLLFENRALRRNAKSDAANQIASDLSRGEVIYFSLKPALFAPVHHLTLVERTILGRLLFPEHVYDAIYPPRINLLLETNQDVYEWVSRLIQKICNYFYEKDLRLLPEDIRYAIAQQWIEDLSQRINAHLHRNLFLLQTPIEACWPSMVLIYNSRLLEVSDLSVPDNECFPLERACEESASAEELSLSYRSYSVAHLNGTEVVSEIDPVTTIWASGVGPQWLLLNSKIARSHRELDVGWHIVGTNSISSFIHQLEQSTQKSERIERNDLAFKELREKSLPLNPYLVDKVKIAYEQKLRSWEPRSRGPFRPM